MRTIIITLLVVGLSFSLTSCVRLVVKGVKKKTKLEYVVPTASMYADGKFQGLSKFIDDAEDTASILMIHGLTRKTEKHFDFLMERLAYKLDLQLIHKKDTLPLKQPSLNRPTNRVLSFGKCKLYTWNFKRRTDGKIVNAYSIYWEPVFKTFKDFIMSYDSTRYRTGLSTIAKDSVFINVLSDLALYLNVRCKVQMHDLFLQSVEKINGDIAVIGNGFGVQILFDAMNLELEYRKVSQHQEEVAKALRGYDKYKNIATILNEVDVDQVQQRNPSIKAGRYIEYKDSADYNRKAPHKFRKQYNIRKVFLIGNQLPFTSLLSLDPKDPTTAKEMNDNVYNGFHKFLEQKQAVNPLDSLVIVSFYDPNDPFGYKLPPSSWERLVVKNVKLNIAEYWQIDPRRTTDFVLPKLKNGEAFLDLIDQQDSIQSLMLNLEGPANQSRNDYRILGAISRGSDYTFVCTQPDTLNPLPRELHSHAKKRFSGVEALASNLIIRNLSHRVDMEHSVLPFSLPSLYRDFDPNKRLSVPFLGIDESVSTNKLTQLITVHGVKNQEPDHFDMMTREIAKTLGFYETPDGFRVVCAEKVCPENTNANFGPGTVKITKFRSVTGKELIIYNVYWSSITRPAKEWLRSASIYNESSIIPKLLKDVLVTDGLGDIELSFQGDSAKIMSLLHRAFIEMQNDFVASGTTAVNQNTYYMTGSLGTRLLLDYLNDHMKEDSTRAVQERTKTWFMLTNQLIITELRNIPLRQDKISYEQYFREAYGPRNAPVRRMLNTDSSRFEIVAFNDPNDIMSFIVPDDAMGIRCGDRIHNTYINIAQGIQVNMNALIKIAWRADKKLQQYHRKKYRCMLHKFKRDSATFLCGQAIYPHKFNKGHEYWEMRNILKMSKKRFRHWFKFDTHLYSERHSKKLDRKINTILAKDTRDFKHRKLEKCLDLKKKRYTTDLYAMSERVRREHVRYKDIKKVEKKSVHEGGIKGRPVIGRSALRKLYRPGLIMPFLRELTNYRMYQDFVSDFGRAHMGSRTNKRIISMMALGFDSVTKTDVDQELYRSIHNKNEH